MAESVAYRVRAISLALSLCTVAAVAQAAPVFEARAGDRDGATLGLGWDAPVKCARVGAVLEFGADDSILLMGRVAYAKPAGKVVFYFGGEAGLAFEEAATQTRTIPPDGRHGRSYSVTEASGDEAGLAVGAFAGVRGPFRPGTGMGWFVEALARDTELTSGAGFAAGLRFRP